MTTPKNMKRVEGKKNWVCNFFGHKFIDSLSLLMLLRRHPESIKRDYILLYCMRCGEEVKV